MKSLKNSVIKGLGQGPRVYSQSGLSFRVLLTEGSLSSGCMGHGAGNDGEYEDDDDGEYEDDDDYEHEEDDGDDDADDDGDDEQDDE